MAKFRFSWVILPERNRTLQFVNERRVAYARVVFNLNDTITYEYCNKQGDLIAKSAKTKEEAQTAILRAVLCGEVLAFEELTQREPG